MGAYFGSKATSGLCQAIIALMPPHETYIESHLGGGAIMKRKPAALRNIGIDRNERALEKFQCAYPVERVHADAHRFLADFDYRGRELLYCDPRTCTPRAAPSGATGSSTRNTSTWSCFGC